jgi:hypothetical protein
LNELQLPDELRGPWRHFVLLTYGADFPFFERALWRQFFVSCRNKVILADGRHYLEACDRFAAGGFIRLMNQHYVADGIYSGRGNHAKMILLVSEEAGRLLVGSGNLSWQGLASGGELFSKYEYPSDDDAHSSGFAVVRDLLQTLTDRGYVGDLVRNRLDALWEGAPWLLRESDATPAAIIHNLRLPLLEQMATQIGDERVDELLVMAPFFDEEAAVLRSLVERFAPRKVTVLVQPKKTSVDPNRLADLLAEFDFVELRPFEISGLNRYVHAKLYLFRTGSRLTCFHGSANVSRAALTLIPPHGNIELLNVSTGPVDEFNHLLSKLSIGDPVEDPAVLDVGLVSDDLEVDPLDAALTLLRAELKGRNLRIDFRGSLPQLSGARLFVGAQDFDLNVTSTAVDSLTATLEDPAAGLLQRPLGISIGWIEGDVIVRSNSVVPSNRTTLDAVLAKPDHTEDLQHLADLELEDEELANLLAALEGTLVLDDRSIWQVAGKEEPAQAAGDDPEQVIAYEDIDYELIRRHPKIQQYKAWGGDFYGKSRLQLILKAITDHFHVVLGKSELNVVTTGISTDTDQPDTETEREQEEEERERRARSLGQRNELLFRNFIRRYLRGFEDRDFRRFVGFDVMVQNYRIFVFILWRLFAKEWMRPDFLVDALLRTWIGFWGSDGKASYLDELVEDEKSRAIAWMVNQQADAELVAALHYCAYLSRTEEWQERRFALRDWLRNFIDKRDLALGPESLGKAQGILSTLIPYETPRPTDIAAELGALLSFDTRTSLVRDLEADLGLGHGACTFERVVVARPGWSGSSKVECLMVKGEVRLSTLEEALNLISRWRSIEPLDYYRVATPDSGGIIFVDLNSGIGYWRPDRANEGVDLVRPIFPRTPRQDAVDALNALALETLAQAEARGTSA